MRYSRKVYRWLHRSRKNGTNLQKRALHEMGEIYQFRLKGHLDESRVEWLNGLSIEQQPDGTTVITGQIADQAALFGLLSRLRDLGMPLLSAKVLVNGATEYTRK